MTRPAAWALAGALLGAALLGVYAVYLLSVDGAGPKVLVAVWLAAPPVLFGGLLGGLGAGWGARAIRR